MKWRLLSFPNSRDGAKEVARKLFTYPLEKRGCEGVDDRLRRFLVPPQRRSDYTDIQMKAAPSGSGRNSYVSSNYSNFLSQNSRRKLPRSSPPPRRKRNRRLRPPRGDLRPSSNSPVSPTVSPRPPHSIHPLRQKRLAPFSQFPERGGCEKPTRKFQARFSHSRNSTLRDAVKGLVRTCAIISRNSFHFKWIRMKRIEIYPPPPPQILLVTMIFFIIIIILH